MSRGEGQLQRRILRLVEKAVQRGDGSLSRRELEDHLEPEGYRSDNVLRALRGLARAGLIEYREARFASNSVVHPPRPFTPFSDEEITQMLSEPGWRPCGARRTPRVSEDKPAPRVEVGSPGREGR